jgi:energy-coupling factor transporter ATP-binding protein EcfA2
VGLQNLQNVNQFPNGRRIAFDADKLNILFGENGAGKSGYARVIKNACRARHRAPVLPNSFDATTPRPIPKGEVSYLLESRPVTVPWTQGEASDLALGKVSVYDSACGQDYLAKEGASDYQPFGLPQMNRLVATQREMQGLIVQERELIRLDAGQFIDLHGEHEVGRFLAGLGPDSDLEMLKSLASVSTQDRDRLEELSDILGTMNPEPAAQNAERLATRLDTVATSAQNAQRYVSEQALAEVRERQAREKLATQAWTLAQKRLKQPAGVNDQELLPGTGNSVWRALFEAAEKFSLQHAYPGHPHPNVGEGARCVLCQSELNEDAKTRLRTFADFIVGEASTSAQEAAKRMVETMSSIEAAILDPFDVPTLEELAEADPQLHAFARATVDTWEKRRAWVKTAVATGDWSVPDPQLIEGEALHTRLRNMANTLRSRAAELRDSLDADAKRKLEEERAALLARSKLAERVERVDEYVIGARAIESLTACYNALNPRRVSMKMTELAVQYVTTALANAMNRELQGLGYRRKVEPQLRGRTDDGQTLVTLSVKESVDAASQVLSEGEQRAMGLALFLAEARLQAHASTLVFDDPSTSLDHHHRRHMASHLVELAAERHVVVLTHDAVFLTEINRVVHERSQPVKYQTVEWEGARPGFVAPGLTWETMNTRDRLADLGAFAGTLTADSGDYPNEATRDRVKLGYTKLRGTIERAVREVFLNNTVRPFVDDVSVDSFGAVIGHPSEEWEQISSIYAVCCEVTDAHDTNAAHQLVIPHSTELLAHISEVRDLVGKADTRRKAYERARSDRNSGRRQPFTE